MKRDELAELFGAEATLEDPWPEGQLPTASEVDGLLGELPWSNFAREQLGVCAHAGQGRVEAYGRLFDAAQARDAIARAHGSGAGYHLRVDSESRGGHGAGHKRELSPAELPGAIAAGATVCVNRIHRGSRKLQAYLQVVLARTGWRGSVGFNCYLSTAEMGFGTHYDFRHVTTLQIAGEKLWTHAERPSIVAPRRGAFVDAAGRPGHAQAGIEANWERFSNAEETLPERRQTLLGCGDYLALPAGTWHAARARGYSLALNLYFQNHYFSESLYRILSPKLHAIEAWREGWPPSPGGLEEDGRIPARQRAYVDARLAELRELVSTLDADHPNVLGALIGLGSID